MKKKDKSELGSVVYFGGKSSENYRVCEKITLPKND